MIVPEPPEPIINDTNTTVPINDTNVTINDTLPINDTNVTLPVNDTTPVNNTNVSQPPVVNETSTNVTINVTDVGDLTPCDDPNINLRPDYCFAGELEIAYEEIVAPIKNKKLETVGRATRYGNLIIRGLLRQYSTVSAGADDFAVGYKDRDGLSVTEVSTAWIDTSSGDLHLAGRIYEEVEMLQPPQYNSYVIQNSNGLILGYIDEISGDLYLKGNIVQLGKI
jgi:hypothetical protein